MKTFRDWHRERSLLEFRGVADDPVLRLTPYDNGVVTGGYADTNRSDLFTFVPNWNLNTKSTRGYVMNLRGDRSAISNDYPEFWQYIAQNLTSLIKEAYGVFVRFLVDQQPGTVDVSRVYTIHKDHQSPLGDVASRLASALDRLIKQGVEDANRRNPENPYKLIGHNVTSLKAHRERGTGMTDQNRTNLDAGQRYLGGITAADKKRQVTTDAERQNAQQFRGARANLTMQANQSFGYPSPVRQPSRLERLASRVRNGT